MKTSKRIRWAAWTLASAGLLVPQATLQAAGPTEMAANPAAVGAAAVGDVALSAGGVLRGQVLNPQGAPIAGTAVTVLASGREVASVQTDARGNFAVEGLRGGSYTVVAGHGGGLYRLWTENSAPPQASSGVLIVSGQSVQRGQSGGGGFFRPATWGVLVLAGGIAAGGLISQANSSENGSGS